VPVSALAGDNVVAPSRHMPWFHGPSLLEHLETVSVGSRVLQAALRFPVQRVVRPNQEFRGYAGTIASGSVRPGDQVTVLPSGRQTAVARIVTFDGDLEEAEAGQSVTLTLEHEIDLSRGDMIVAAGEAPGELPDQLPWRAHAIEAMLVWLNEKPAEVGKRYRLKHAVRQDWATLRQVKHRVNINTFEPEPKQSLEMNAIGLVIIDTARALCFDSYSDNRLTGSFILIDAATNATVAAGMIVNPAEESGLDPLAGVSWRVEDGALVLRSEQGFASKGPAANELLEMEDPEALDALRHLLRRLRIHPFDAGESDWEI
jgi:sulfate adenylyltransferase subunit 1 (EFTu-like GTPase family)